MLGFCVGWCPVCHPVLGPFPVYGDRQNKCPPFSQLCILSQACITGLNKTLTPRAGRRLRGCGDGCRSSLAPVSLSLAWARFSQCWPGPSRGGSRPAGGGLTSTAAQLLPNSWGLVNSKFSGVRISLMVFKSKFPQRPASWPWKKRGHRVSCRLARVNHGRGAARAQGSVMNPEAATGVAACRGLGEGPEEKGWERAGPKAPSERHRSPSDTQGLGSAPGRSRGPLRVTTHVSTCHCGPA